MRRTLLLLATMAFVLIVAGGVALAASIIYCPGGEDCFGTPGDDRIEGSDGDDIHIFGSGGSDIIDANGGSEHVVGDHLTDRSLDGDDKLDGGPDPDRIYGFGGSDTLIGGQGEDYIDAQSYETSGASNTIRGGSENDQIDANNGVYDRIDCGTGSDTVTVDLNDLDKVAKNCERVDPLPAPTSG
jgi:hypothetical protein